MNWKCLLGIHTWIEVSRREYEQTRYDSMEGGIWAHSVKVLEITYACGQCPKIKKAYKHPPKIFVELKES